MKVSGNCDTPQLHHRLWFFRLCLENWGLIFVETILQTILERRWGAGCAEGVWVAGGAGAVGVQGGRG